MHPADIKNLKGPVFVLMAGASGSGKSWTAEQFLNQFPIHDPDLINIEQNGEYNEKKSSKAVAELEKRCKTSIEKKESFVRQGVCVNENAARKRLREAKDNGFTTIVLHVDVPVEQAIKQNLQRGEEGNRTIPDDKLYKIERGYQRVDEVMNVIKDESLADFYIRFKNDR